MSITKFSPSFIELCLKTDLKPGDDMPCPRCGKEGVRYKDPKSYRMGGAAGVVVAGLFWSVFRGSVGLMATLVAGIFFLVSLSLEQNYTCPHCDHQWRARDVAKWVSAIRHDQEARVRRSQI